jgi:hypothetical protein
MFNSIRSINKLKSNSELIPIQVQCASKYGVAGYTSSLLNEPDSLGLGWTSTDSPTLDDGVADCLKFTVTTGKNFPSGTVKVFVRNTIASSGPLASAWTRSGIPTDPVTGYLPLLFYPDTMSGPGDNLATSYYGPDIGNGDFTAEYTSIDVTVSNNSVVFYMWHDVDTITRFSTSQAHRLELIFKTSAGVTIGTYTKKIRYKVGQVL